MGLILFTVNLRPNIGCCLACYEIDLKAILININHHQRTVPTDKIWWIMLQNNWQYDTWQNLSAASIYCTFIIRINFHCDVIGHNCVLYRLGGVTSYLPD